MTDLDFGFRVRTRRRALGISQGDLAKAVGISQPAIKKIEAGGNTRHGRKIAVVLRTTLKWLETGVDADVDRDGKPTHSSASGPVISETSREVEPWPFKKSTLDRIQTLDPLQRKKLDDVIDTVLKGFEAEGK